MPTVMATFVQATYGLATFVHNSIFSTVTDPILTKVWEPIFWVLIFVTEDFFWTKLLLTQIFFRPHIFCIKIFVSIFYTQNFVDKKCFSLRFFGSTNMFTQIIWATFFNPKFFGLQLFFGSKISLAQKFFSLDFFWRNFFFDQKCFEPHFFLTKTTIITTTTTALMGFDTIESNLVPTLFT